MIEKFEDLDLQAVDELDAVLQKIQEKLGVSCLDLQNALSTSVQEKAYELTHSFVNMAPLGDYGKLIENIDDMAEFLQTEAHKPEHWKLHLIQLNKVKGTPDLIKFTFNNDSIDDGEAFTGFVFVSFQGKIKHAFAQGNE